MASTANKETELGRRIFDREAHRYDRQGSSVDCTAVTPSPGSVPDDARAVS